MHEASTPEVDSETEDELGDVAAVKAKIKKVRDELEKAKKERQEYLDGWQRCRADSINAKKEAQTAGARSGERKLESLIEDLLPALDGFDMAAGNPAWETVGAEWRSGVERIRNHLLDVLARYGAHRYGTVGDVFDPTIHEAMQEVDDAPGEPHSVVRILRYGYRKGERILRPAQVVVKV